MCSVCSVPGGYGTRACMQCGGQCVGGGGGVCIQCGAMCDVHA